MTPDHPSLEAELRDLKAVGLDESFLTRLEASADGTWTRLSPQEIGFEKSLREISAAPLPAEFMAELQRIVAKAPFPADVNIVPFPTVHAAPPRHRQRPMWGAAAAVAIIGAATALLVPTGGPPANHNRPLAAAAPSVASTAPRNFVPAGYNTNLSEVHDEGVIWKSNNQPHSVVRMVYKDQVILKDANGRTVQVEQPRVEYMLVPAKTD
jgi:hypothetical protein